MCARVKCAREVCERAECMTDVLILAFGAFMAKASSRGDELREPSTVYTDWILSRDSA